MGCKKLGLVGGMGPESTISYYHDIVYGVQKRVGKHVFPELAIESVNVFKVLDLCRREEYRQLTDYLAGAVNNLALGGADFGALSANTPHIVFEQLKKRSPIPLVSIVEAVAAETRSLNISKAGLLGTIFTMEGVFFKEPFKREGIDIAVPDEVERKLVNEKIAAELERGIVKAETRELFGRIIERMQEDEAIEAVILGCTELPLLFNGTELPLRCLDTMEIHVRTIVDMITADEVK